MQPPGASHRSPTARRTTRRLPRCVHLLGLAALLSVALSAAAQPIPSSYQTGLKDGFGTSATTQSKVWFTLTRGAVSEVFAPMIDNPMLRGIEFLVVGRSEDGAVLFVDREQRDLVHEVVLPDARALLFEVRSRSATRGYRLVKRIFTDPGSDVLLVQGALERAEPAGDGAHRLELYVLADALGCGRGDDDVGRIEGAAFLLEDRHAFVLEAEPALTGATVGILGVDDALMSLGMLASQPPRQAAEAPMPTRAGPGNILFAGLIPGEGRSRAFTIRIGFGPTADAARAALAASRSREPEAIAQDYRSGWNAFCDRLRPPPEPADVLYWASAQILAACEDKTSRGAFIASPTMPWGEEGGPWGDARGDSSDQFYFKVWSRDLYHTTTALLAAGDAEPALRALAFLDERLQQEDGSFPQAADVRGRVVWPTVQLDQVAAPILLAHRLQAAGLLDPSDRWASLVRPAADYIADHGPATRQERWENLDGYSPASIASAIAALAAAADIAHRNDDRSRFVRYRLLAAQWDRELENRTFTIKPSRWSGDGHYVRISRSGDPNELDFSRDDLDVSFLELVRLGVRSPDDPLILLTLAACDAHLGRRLPTGDAWFRFGNDNYGENGQGRAWPLLTGERGHYEIAAGRSAATHIEFLRRVAHGVILPEQVWDVGPLAGRATGAAAPLAWAHGEYLKLVLSESSGQVVDLPEVMRARAGNRPGGAPRAYPFVSEVTSEMNAFRVYASRDQENELRGEAMRVELDGVVIPAEIREGYLVLARSVTGFDSVVRVQFRNELLYEGRPLLPVAARAARRTPQWVSIAGAFNHWNPADRTLELEPGPGGSLRRSIRLDPGRYEYKFAVNGSWELNYGGRGTTLQRNGPNFVLEVREAGHYTFQVDLGRSWHAVEGPAPP